MTGNSDVTRFGKDCRPIRPVHGELLLRRATWHETLLHPFLYVIDFKRALSFGEAQGFDVAIKTSASDSEAYCCAMAVSSEVVEDIAKCYVCFILSSVPLKLTVGQNDFRPKP